MRRPSMRKFIRPALEAALAALDAPFSLVDGENAIALRSHLASWFSRQGDAMSLQWSNLLDYVAIQHPHAWQWVDEFIERRQAYLFAYLEDEPAIFLLGEGVSVSTVLAECPGFEFYEAATDLSYLICENMNEYLLGVGLAKSWVDSLRPRHEAWVRSLTGNSSS
jgi:hypothetical protein